MKFQYFDLGVAEYREKSYVKQLVLSTLSYFYNTKQETLFNCISRWYLCDGVIYLLEIIYLDFENMLACFIYNVFLALLLQ